MGNRRYLAVWPVFAQWGEDAKGNPVLQCDWKRKEFGNFGDASLWGANHSQVAGRSIVIIEEETEITDPRIIGPTGLTEWKEVACWALEGGIASHRLD